MRRPKILVVDDEEDMLLMLRGILQEDCVVFEASNGLDALSLVQREHPQLVLLDLEMPEMDGVQVLAAVRRISPKIIVMMLTGVDDVDSALRALQQGARAYVTKPFDPRYLRREVRRLLEPPDRKKDDAPWHVKE
jgi:DNA-binding response OmpR family regulator